MRAAISLLFPLIAALPLVSGLPHHAIRQNGNGPSRPMYSVVPLEPGSGDDEPDSPSGGSSGGSNGDDGNQNDTGDNQSSPGNGNGASNDGNSSNGGGREEFVTVVETVTKTHGPATVTRIPAPDTVTHTKVVPTTVISIIDMEGDQTSTVVQSRPETSQEPAVVIPTVPSEEPVPEPPVATPSTTPLRASTSSAMSSSTSSSSTSSSSTSSSTSTTTSTTSSTSTTTTPATTSSTTVEDTTSEVIPVLPTPTTPPASPIKSQEPRPDIPAQSPPAVDNGQWHPEPAEEIPNPTWTTLQTFTTTEASVSSTSTTYDNGQWRTTYPAWNETAWRENPY